MKRFTRLMAISLAIVLAASIAGCSKADEKAPETTPTESSFIATVTEVHKDSVTVEPIEGAAERASADRITFATGELDDISVRVGNHVKVTYDGQIMESYPAQIHASGWEITGDLRSIPYTGQWLDKNTADRPDYDLLDDLIIYEIYADCFLATPAMPLPTLIKMNGQLSEDWCVGDQVACTYENVYYDRENNRIEADMLTIEAGTWEAEPGVCYKPVIYLYPEETTDVSVKLELQGKLTCTYPIYQDGWCVTAAPDGTLTDSRGQVYNYLYWEGETDARWDMEKGFCVKGEDTAAFLEEALEKLGLTRKEANEFIVYWLPLMEQNPYNIISFQSDTYTEAAKLKVSPAPDTVIRVFMTWQPAESYVNLEPQELTAPERTGFTVVEWGGTQID